MVINKLERVMHPNLAPSMSTGGIYDINIIPSGGVQTEIDLQRALAARWPIFDTMPPVGFDRFFLEYQQTRAVTQFPSIIDGIFINGGIGIQILPDSPSGFRREYVVHERRVLSRLYGRNPEFARAIVDMQATGIHASLASSLLSVIEHGLLSQQDMAARGLPVITGEIGIGSASPQGVNAKGAISLNNWDDRDGVDPYLLPSPFTMATATAEMQKFQQVIIDAQVQGATPLTPLEDTLIRLNIARYRAIVDILQQQPNTELAQLIQDGFPVLYFVGNDQFENKPRIFRQSQEIGVMGPLPVSIIAVPRSEVSRVQQIVQQHQPNGASIQVFPLEDYFDSQPLPSRLSPIQPSP